MASLISGFVIIQGTTLTIAPQDFEDSGIYDITLYLQDDNSLGAGNGVQSDSLRFILTIVATNTAPAFTGLVPDFEFNLGEVYKVLSPPVEDAEQTEGFLFEYFVNDRPPPSFMEIGETSIEIKPTDLAHVGIYTVQIIVSDTVQGVLRVRVIIGLSDFRG